MISRNHYSRLLKGEIMKIFLIFVTGFLGVSTIGLSAVPSDLQYTIWNLTKVRCGVAESTLITDYDLAHGIYSSTITFATTTGSRSWSNSTCTNSLTTDTFSAGSY